MTNVLEYTVQKTNEDGCLDFFTQVWTHNLKVLQGLLSTTYQVEVTFSVKGGAEQQKSIFVKVLKSKYLHPGSYHLFD